MRDIPPPHPNQIMLTTYKPKRTYHTMKLPFIFWALVLAFPLATPPTHTTGENRTLIKATNLAKPNCESKCGDLIVPYPFGIGLGKGCSIGRGFDIYCNTSVDPPRPSFGEHELQEIKEISDSRIRASNLLAWRCYNSSESSTNDYFVSMNVLNWPYTISQVNKFTVIGCYDYAWLSSTNNQRNVSTGCLVSCLEQRDVMGGDCSGNGCCQSSIPKDIHYYTTRVRRLASSDNDTSAAYIRSFNPCSYAFVGEEDTFKFNGLDDLKDSSFVERIEASVPIVFDWAIGNLSCTEARKSTESYTCQSNSTCVDSGRDIGGYRCICDDGYGGNPYLPPGCQDIDECKDNTTYPCYGVCGNIQGHYTCICRHGYSGNASTPTGCQKMSNKPFPVLPLTLGMGSGLFAIFIAIFVSCFAVKKRKLIKLRERFFEQNGGELLKEKLKTQGGINSMSIYSVEELKEATNNYAEDRIVGRGGYGIVYKGILPDNKVVAIKQSQKLDKGQQEQFINEMAILTQINHRNVVKLLGCCLETEVPSLVYEFVPNDTLFYHIHNRKSDMVRLSWNNRLRIACESAGALAYLHSAASMPIIHRDVKSSNILLDESYTVKIADFGASRLVPLDHDQVTTLVQGTLGYLDPEYFHTGQLTSKSDVYSFGVVLAELLTGEKPLRVERSQEERNLATYFVKSMKENRLVEIIEPQVGREGSAEQLKAVGELVKRCLHLIGEDRPTMKEVAMKLERSRTLGIHPWISQDGYNETSSIMIEMEQTELYTVPLIPYSNTFGDFSSSSTNMNDMMLQMNGPR